MTAFAVGDGKDDRFRVADEMDIGDIRIFQGEPLLRIGPKPFINRIGTAVNAIGIKA